MTTVDNRPRGTGSRTYRDATINRQTRDALAELLEWLEDTDRDRWSGALGEVVERWDANEATQVRI